MKPYWLGWEVPHSIPEEDMAEVWPEGMKGWCSGSGEGYQTWVGLIYADSAEDAVRIMLSCYPKHVSQITDRWEAHEANVENLIACGRWGGIGDFVEAHAA